MKVVLKFGGSIFAPPEGVDLEFMKSTAEHVKRWIQNHEVAIVVGGGKPSREYGELGRQLTDKEDLLDWIGIMSARLNASLFIAAMGDSACPEIPRSEEEFTGINQKYPGKIIVSGGFRPKQRTDAVAVEIAKEWNADLIIKGTNVDYVYDKDPNKFDDAKPIKEISTEELQKMVSADEYKANAPTIMDRTAASILLEGGIKTIVVNGQDLDNIENILDGKEFKGTKVGF